MTFFSIRDMGIFGTNCYIIETSGKKAILIDAPFSAAIISEELEKRGLSLEIILLTHGHCDHIEALNGLKEKYGCEVYIAEGDKPMLSDRRRCLAQYFGTPFEPFEGAKTIADGQIITLDDVSVKAIETPGHSKGSVCYFAENVIFTGDTLFDGSVGRTDLGGSHSTLLRSIARLYEDGENHEIYPGHGGPSDLYTELINNPYLEELRQKL